MNVVVRRRVGVALWCGGALVAMMWSGLRTARYEAPGMGFAPPVEVAPLEAGRLAALDVKLHDVVTADQILARIDPTPIEEELAVATATLLAVQAEQASAAANEARKFAEGVEGTLLDTARMRAAMEEDRALAASLREQLAIEQGLAGSGASSGQQVRQIQRDLDVVEARLAATRSAYALAAGAQDAARERSDELPLANEWSVVAAARMVEQIEGRRDRLDLQAGIEGQVTAIYRTAGSVVAEGEWVLQVTRTGTNEVVAWLPTAAADRALSGASAHVVRASGEVLRGQVASVGSGPQPMPQQLWMNPAYPQWGLPVRIQLANGEVGAQEPVTVRI